MESIGGKSNSTYTKWSEKDRYLIGKYASENGVAAGVRELKIKFPNFNESTVRSFRKKVEAELRKASKEKREPSKVIVKYSSTTGRPFEARTIRFNRPNLLDCTKSMRLCNH